MNNRFLVALGLALGLSIGLSWIATARNIDLLTNESSANRFQQQNRNTTHPAHTSGFTVTPSITVYLPLIVKNTPVLLQWSDNVRVNDDTESATQTEPAIASDASGTAYAVWIDWRNGGQDVYFASNTPDGSWLQNVKINDNLTWAHNPAIGADAAGNIHAIWQSYGGLYNVLYAYRPSGGNWGIKVKVNDDSGTPYKQRPKISVDEMGNAYAIWQDYRNDPEGSCGSTCNSDVYFSYKDKVGNWQANLKINDDGGITGQSAPSIALDGTRNAYAVWSDPRNGSSPNIYFSYRAAGGMWGANAQVNDDSGSASHFWPMLAVDFSGNTCAIWVDNRNGNGDIWSSYRPSGGSWGPSMRVNDDIGTDEQISPSIGMDGSGNIYAIWVDLRGGQKNIYSAFLPKTGNKWSVNTRVNDHDGSVAIYTTGIAIDSNGDVRAIWEDTRNGNSDIYSAYLVNP